MKVLFVCSANACRSLMAERLSRKMASERGLAGWEARSCGTAAESFFKVPREVRELLRERAGEDVSGHTPRLVTEDWMDWADCVIVMEEAHRRELLERFPQAWKKTVLLDPAGDVADPIGGEAADYAACFERIRLCLDRILGSTISLRP